MCERPAHKTFAAFVPFIWEHWGTFASSSLLLLGRYRHACYKTQRTVLRHCDSVSWRFGSKGAMTHFSSWNVLSVIHLNAPTYLYFRYSTLMSRILSFLCPLHVCSWAWISFTHCGEKHTKLYMALRWNGTIKHWDETSTRMSPQYTIGALHVLGFSTLRACPTHV